VQGSVIVDMETPVNGDGAFIGGAEDCFQALP